MYRIVEWVIGICGTIMRSILLNDSKGSATVSIEAIRMIISQPEEHHPYQWLYLEKDTSRKLSLSS